MVTDVLIIGAGPCGLAVAARLRETTPSALFTDDEHARYWKRFKRKETLQREVQRQRKHSSSSTASSRADSGYASEAEQPAKSPKPHRPSLTVLDASSNTWMDTWSARFAALQITHLRSPLFFHPDPRDRDGLLAYAYEQGREAELVEIPNVVGKEISKHARKKERRKLGSKHDGKPRTTVERHLRVDNRDRIDYFTPSTALFRAYCDSLVRRYGLGGVVQQATVKNIRYGYADEIGFSIPTIGSETRLFAVETGDKFVHFAKIVVVASGPGSGVPLSQPQGHNLHLSSLDSTARLHTSHVFAPGGMCLPQRTKQRLESKASSVDIAIVGGGLTAAQLACTLLSTYPTISKVHINHRSKLKFKAFDVDLPWVTKTRNTRMAEFWSAETDAERSEMLRTAKGGGSISPLFEKMELRKWIRAGRVVIHEHTTIVDGHFDDDSGDWTLNLLKTASPKPVLEDHNIENIQLKRVAHVFYATGASPNFPKIPYLRSLQAVHPLETISGLPVLTEDLAWSEDVPMLFTGALAALRLGPGAANLAGARLGAERIAWKVEELLKRADSGRDTGTVDSAGTTESNSSLKDVDASEPRRALDEFTGSATNRFDTLRFEDFE